MSPIGKYFTVADVAQRYGITVNNVYALKRRHDVKGITAGKRLLLFTEAEVRKLKPGKRGRPKAI